MKLEQETFVTRVFGLMAEKKMTISDLVKATGIPGARLKFDLHLDNELPYIRAETIAELAKTFGVTMEYLLGVTNVSSLFVASDWDGEDVEVSAQED